MQTIQADNRIRIQPEQARRCKRGTKKPAQERTAIPVEDAFLKHRFLPLYQPSGHVPERKQAERGFFKSLSILSGLYDCEIMDVEDKPYPYNILLAHWDMLRLLNTTNQRVELAIVKDDKDDVQLATKQVYDTGTTLYFIPVIPLYRLLQDKQQKRCAELLLSVCCYLYRHAGIPYYRDDYSSLSYYYDIIREWTLDDIGSYTEHEINSNLSVLNEAEYYGDIMFRKIYNPYHLNAFPERIRGFKPRTPFERNCLQLAKEACNLMMEYPERSIFTHTKMDSVEDDEDNEYIKAEQYISFIAKNEGWVFEQMSEMINNEFNEYALMEEPTIVQVFNSEVTIAEGLEFEQRIFPLIDDLVSILNEIP